MNYANKLPFQETISLLASKKFMYILKKGHVFVGQIICKLNEDSKN